MNRISASDLRAKFEQFRELNRRAGITRELTTWSNNDRGPRVLTADDMALQFGSKTYGNAFRVFYVNPDGGGHCSLDSVRDYLGMTKREAWDTLDALCAGMYAVLDSQAPRGEIFPRFTR